MVTLGIASFLLGMEVPINSIDSTIKWGHSARQGKRPTMEDTFCELNPQDEEWGNNGLSGSWFFALFDGHSGSEAAQYAAENISTIFTQELKGNQTIDQAFTKTFQRLDKEICTQYSCAGTTALAAYINNETLHIGWAGDSRAILIRDGKVIGTTIDHNGKTNESENNRIRNVGGWIEYNRHGNPYALGSLAPTRTLGDRNKKTVPNAIIPDPEIIHCTIQLGDTIVLACDGLGDVMTNDEVASLVGLHGNENASKKIKPEEVMKSGGNASSSLATAQCIRDMALAKGSTDNISVVVINIGAKELCPQQQEVAREKTANNWVQLAKSQGKKRRLFAGHY